MSLDFTPPRQPQVNEPRSTLPVHRHFVSGSALEPSGQTKQKSRMVSFRIDEHDFNRLDNFAQQTSCSRAEVLRRLLRTARLESTVDAQALTEVSRVHVDLNRIGGLLKLAI
jgi:predicted DNA-binding protein